MGELNETPRGNRVHIAFFGLRNAGKSTLVNAFVGQPVAIVSDVAGTTTDPVSKAMEILPLGPCLITDTAGLDDTGDLGRLRVEKTLKVLETADISVWVASEGDEGVKGKFLEECRRRGVPVFEHRRGESVEELKRKISAVKLEETVPPLLDGLVKAGDRVICVAPIDGSAPRGRIILPQQQVIRECLDRHLVCAVCQPDELSDCLAMQLAGLAGRGGAVLVITDSQAFREVGSTLQNFAGAPIALTSFSILYARQKGDLGEYERGLQAIGSLKDGDTVLVAEGCTHHRQCNDIGLVKIPKALAKLTGKKLNIESASGQKFEIERQEGRGTRPYALVVHCGACMLTRREMLRRIALAKSAGVPIVNYGLLLQAAATDNLSGVRNLWYNTDK